MMSKRVSALEEDALPVPVLSVWIFFSFFLVGWAGGDHVFR